MEHDAGAPSRAISRLERGAWERAQHPGTMPALLQSGVPAAQVRRAGRVKRQHTIQLWVPAARQGTFIKNERAQDLDGMQRHEGLAALGERVRLAMRRRAAQARHAGQGASPGRRSALSVQNSCGR